jgi:anti-sigma regulatory factor (Ser/Thr protein kinase)
LNLQIKNDLSQLEIVTRALNDFIKKQQLPIKVAKAIELALDEILNNIIIYGFNDKDEHLINITISLQEESVVLEINDDGLEFNPLTTPKPDTTGPMEDRPVGGLGIHLTRSLMDEINYTYKNNRNHLLMKKKLKET